MISLANRRRSSDPGKSAANPAATATATAVPLGPTALDGTGRVLTGDEFVKHTRTMGLCEKCGETRTHLRVKHTMSLTPRLKPITSKSDKGTFDVYKGYCLGPRCWRLDEVKRLLGETVATGKKRYKFSSKTKKKQDLSACSNSAVSSGDTPPNNRKDLSLIITNSGRPVVKGSNDLSAKRPAMKTREARTGKHVVAADRSKVKGHAKTNNDPHLLGTKSRRPVLLKRSNEDPPYSANNKEPKDVSLVITGSGRPIFHTLSPTEPVADNDFQPQETNQTRRPAFAEKTNAHFKPRKNARRNRAARDDDYDLCVTAWPGGRGTPVDVDFVTEILDEPSLRGKHVTIHMDSQGDMAAVQEKEPKKKNAKHKVKKESRQEASLDGDDSKRDSVVQNQPQRASSAENGNRTSPVPFAPISEHAIQAFEEQMPSRSRRGKNKYLSSLLSTRPTRTVDVDKVDQKTTDYWKRSSCPALMSTHASSGSSSSRSPLSNEAQSTLIPKDPVAVVVTPCTHDSCVSELDAGELITGFEIELTTEAVPVLSETFRASESIEMHETDSREETITAPAATTDSLVGPSLMQRSRGSRESFLHDESTLSACSLPVEQSPGDNRKPPQARRLESITSMTTVAAGNLSGTVVTAAALGTSSNGGNGLSKKANNGVNIISPKYPLLADHTSQEAISLATSQSSSSTSRQSTRIEMAKNETPQHGRDDCRSLVSDDSADSDALDATTTGSKQRLWNSSISKRNRKRPISAGKQHCVAASLTHSVIARRLYPENDKSFRHARNAGVLWQTLVGQHVRFPETWFEGARAPPMGVVNVWNKKGEHVPQHRWLYIAREVFHSVPVFVDLVPDEFAPGRLLLHIIIRDNDSLRAVQDVAIGAYHPKKGRHTRTVWMAIRRRSLHHVGTTATIDPILCSECRIEDIKMASPLGKDHRLHNKSLQTLFGDEPPVQTVFIQEKELVKKVHAFRNAGYMPDFITPITLVLIKIFLETRAEL